MPAQPPISLIFNGRELARIGDGVTEYIYIPFPIVERQSAVRNYIECDAAEVEDNGNTLYTLQIRVLRVFADFLAAQRWSLNHIANFKNFKGELIIREDGRSYRMPDALLSIDGEQELLGSSIEIVYTFKSGKLSQIL